jgi:hypothetical protein
LVPGSARLPIEIAHATAEESGRLREALDLP